MSANKGLVLRGRWWLAGILALLGLNAVVAAYGFLRDPDGSSIGIPVEWLEGSPFETYLVPGIVLMGMGVLSLAAATLQWRRHSLAWVWSGMTGAGFVIWIIVQSMMMGSFRHPIQTTLQAVVLGLALVLCSLSFRQFRDWESGKVSPINP